MSIFIPILIILLTIVLNTLYILKDDASLVIVFFTLATYAIMKDRFIIGLFLIGIGDYLMLVSSFGLNLNENYECLKIILFIASLVFYIYRLYKHLF